jgi:hypothetical protein
MDIFQKSTCPILIKMFSDKLTFSKLMRIVRIINVLMNYLTELPVECEILLNLLNRNLIGNWQSILCFEFYRNWDFNSSFQIYQRLSKVYKEVLNLMEKTISQQNVSGNVIAISNESCVKIPL